MKSVRTMLVSEINYYYSSTENSSHENSTTENSSENSEEEETYADQWNVHDDVVWVVTT